MGETSEEIRDAVQGVVKMLKSTSSGTKDSGTKPDKEQTIKDMTLPDIYSLIDQHKVRLYFLKDNDMLSDENKLEIVQRVKEIYYQISKRHSNISNSDNTNTSPNTDKEDHFVVITTGKSISNAN